MRARAFQALANWTTLACIVAGVIGIPLADAALRLHDLSASFLVAGSLAAGLLAWRLLRVVPRHTVAHFAAAAEDGAARFDTVLNNISLGLCFFDGAQRLIVANRRYAELYDLPPGSIAPGTTLAEIVDRRFASGAFPEMSRDQYLVWRRSISVSNIASDTVVELKNGRVISIHHRPMPDGGWVATHEDITERRRAETRITHMARHDVLTGLPNRAMLWEHMADALAQGEAGGAYAILLLDLDRFKAVNDTLGHPVGDALLRAVAVRLRSAVRAGDVVARLGGDEFAIIQMASEQPATAIALAERLVELIGASFTIDGHTIGIGISVGIALGPIHGLGPEDVLKKADLSLYDVKAHGRGHFRVFQSDIEDRMRARHALEQDLHCAVAEGQFELVYQPVIGAVTDSIVAFEALVRWRHPTRGLIEPAEFIPIAEETGLIVKLGQWILRTACAEAASWLSPLRVAVNLSAMQFAGGSLARTIAEALLASGLAAPRLELEVTESVLADREVVSKALTEMRALGVHIALDDFGIGYSSLSYLQSFPFDRIKIDRSFVRDIAARPQSAAIVSAIIALSRALGLATTAQGVQTAQQRDILVQLGCTDMQGHLFTEAVPAAEARDLASRYRHARLPPRPDHATQGQASQDQAAFAASAT